MARRRRKSQPIKSKRQAGLFGIAAGKGPFAIQRGPSAGKRFDVSKKKAKEKLRKVKVSKLPLMSRKRKRR